MEIEKCTCSEDCTCGCQEGQECTCNGECKEESECNCNDENCECKK